jgi:hypothetical protein
LKLAHRQGYFADDPLAVSRHGQTATAAKDAPPPYDPMRTAMLHGGPVPTQIVLETEVRRIAGEPEAAVANGNQVNPKTKGPFVKYLVRYRVSPLDLSCPTDAAQVHHCRVEFVANVFDADGMLMNFQVNGIAPGIDEARYKAIRNGKFAYTQQISVPAKGEFYLRLGVSDMESGRIGALELPLAALSKVAPVAAQR